MASKRNTILDAFQAVAEAAVGSGRSVIGVINPKDISTVTRLEIWWQSDFGSHVDTNNERTLLVTTAIKFKFDSSDKAGKGATQLHQASEHYDAFHAAVETAFNDRGASSTAFTGIGYLNIEQQEPGIVCDGFDDGDDYLRIGEVWKVTYRRTEGATT